MRVHLWVERLASEGAAVTVVNHAAQLLEDPHVRARGTVVEAAGTPVPANPIRLRTADGRQTSTATDGPPRFGADTEDVLAAAGFSAREIATLAAEGVI
jgi:alpha-methylacyl-CoA racemase